MHNDLRNFREIENKKFKLNYIDNIASFCLRDYWNRLPLEVKNIEKLFIFKSAINKVIKENWCET